MPAGRLGLFDFRWWCFHIASGWSDDGEGEWKRELGWFVVPAEAVGYVLGGI